MKLPTLLLTASCLILLLALPARAQTPCDDAKDQVEMNNCAHNEFVKSDAELNRVYKILMAKLEKPAQAKLKTAEKAWIAYRDAQCTLECADNEGGTIYPMVYNFCLASKTNLRTRELNDMLKEMNNK